MNQKNDKGRKANGNHTNENRTIQKVALLAFGLNLVLALIKGWLAHQSASLAVTASAIDSASDSVASLAVFGGLLLSTRKTRAFPLGLYKIENMASVVIALFIFFAGYEIAVKLIQPPSQAPDITMALLWQLLGCTAAIFAFGKYALYLGNKTESPTLKAEGRHRQVDVLSSLVVLVAVVLNYYQIDFQFYFITLDRLAAFFVLIFIIKAGWELLSDGMRVLLDASVDYATLDKARVIIENEPAVKAIDSLAGRNAGRFRFLEAEITMRTHDLNKAHHIANTIESAIKKEIPHVERIILHYAPSKSIIQKMAFPVLKDGDVICDHFGEAPFFAIWEIHTRQREIQKHTLLKNPFTEVEKGKGIAAARFLTEQQVDRVGAKKKMQHSGPGYVFSDAGVETLEISENSAEEAVTRIYKVPHALSENEKHEKG